MAQPLRIWHCHCCGSGLIPGPGISTYAVAAKKVIIIKPRQEKGAVGGSIDEVRLTLVEVGDGSMQVHYTGVSAYVYVYVWNCP